MIARIGNWLRGPIVPILIINSSLNQERAVNLLAKLRKVDFKRAKAIALNIEIQNHMPVQVDKIVEFIKFVKQNYQVPVYGFCHSHVSTQAYYLLSVADKLYTHNSCIFELKRGVKGYSNQGLLSWMGISKFSIKSNELLSGVNLDEFTSANTNRYINQKISQINDRLLEQAMKNRKRGEKDIPPVILGEQAIRLGLADSTGSYYDILKSNHPECQLMHVKLRDKISTRQIEAIIASPIIIILFLFKVLLKYTILMYLWVKHKAKNERTDNIRIEQIWE